MPLSLLDPDLIGLRDAAAWLSAHAGVPVSYRSVHGWTRAGIKGRKLETLRVGGRIVTSKAALESFFHALNGDRVPEPGPVRTARSNADVERALKLLGGKR